MEEKKAKKRNNATITFSQKEQKERLLQQLNSVQLQNLMKDSTSGDAYKKDCQKVIWAVGYLYDLAVKGKIRVQVPLFEENSQEKQGMLEEIDALKKRVKELEGLEDGYIQSVNDLTQGITEKEADLKDTERLLQLYKSACRMGSRQVNEERMEFCINGRWYRV